MSAAPEWPPAPSKVVATHLSYRSRCDEYRMAAPPDAPSYFLKPPSSLSGHEAEVARPRDCHFLNYEGEIALVIGGHRLVDLPERLTQGALDRFSLHRVGRGAHVATGATLRAASTSAS